MRHDKFEWHAIKPRSRSRAPIILGIAAVLGLVVFVLSYADRHITGTRRPPPIAEANTPKSADKAAAASSISELQPANSVVEEDLDLEDGIPPLPRKKSSVRPGAALERPEVKPREAKTSRQARASPLGRLPDDEGNRASASGASSEDFASLRETFLREAFDGARAGQ